MDHKFIEKFMNLPILLGIGFIFFSFGLGLFLQNGLIIFLSWNMTLALSVYFFSSLTLFLHEKSYKPIFVMITLFIWIILFPNSFYILTDTIHFQDYDFFQTYPNVYQLDLYDWYVFFDITIGALLSIKIGLMSLEQIKKIVPLKMKQYQSIYIIMLFVISSIGIYLGRFIRLNSWNIFDISSILEGIFNHFEFFIIFVLMFTIIHLTIYSVFKEKGE